MLAARGSELEREFPYGVVRQLLEGVGRGPREPAGRSRGARCPVFGSPEGEGDVSFAALHGLFWVALNLAAERPLVLAVDDLHWCDRPSLRFHAYRCSASARGRAGPARSRPCGPTSPDGTRRRAASVRMTSRAVTITLELRLAGDELDGRAMDGDGDGRSFSGWLGLLVAIDALVQGATPEGVEA